MGKYIKKFDTHSDYEDFIETEDFIRPNVSYCVDNKDVHYNSIQTLFALEILSGEFISFYFQSGALYANTDDGSSALWVLDDDGVVIDNISYSIGDRAPILEQINEQYGTSFTGWSDNEIGLRIGDTMPNWDAYEKIEMPSVYVAVFPTSSSIAYIAGKVKGEIFTILANTENSCLIINGNGTVNTIYGPPPTMQALSYAIGRLADNGITVTQTNAEISTLGVGDSVPNWNEYSVIL